MTAEEVRTELENNADEEYRRFHAGLIPGARKLIGVRRPVLRTLAKRIIKEDGRAFLKEAGRESEEEIVLRGLVIAGLPADTGEILSLARGYIPEITDWSICDSFCSAMKRARKERERFWEFTVPYLTSKEEFEARFAAVMLLSHFVCGEWIGRTLPALFTVSQPDYYAQMAVAWAYSVCYVRFPEETEAFLASHRLPEFAYQKTVSKICDSFRVPLETKKRLRTNGFGVKP